MEDDNIFMCEYMTGLPTLAKVQDGDTDKKNLSQRSVSVRKR